MNRIETASTTMMRTKTLAPSSSMRSSLLWRVADCGMVFGCGQARATPATPHHEPSRRLSASAEANGRKRQGSRGRERLAPSNNIRRSVWRSDLAAGERNAGKQAEREQPTEQRVDGPGLAVVMVGDRAGSGETDDDGEDLSGHHTSLRIPQSPVGRRGRNRGSNPLPAGAKITDGSTRPARAWPRGGSPAGRPRCR